MPCEVGQYCHFFGCHDAGICELNDGSLAAPTEGCICIYKDKAEGKVAAHCKHGTYCDGRGCIFYTSRTVVWTVVEPGLIIFFVILCLCCVVGSGVYCLRRRRARGEHVPANVELQPANVELQPAETEGKREGEN